MSRSSKIRISVWLRPPRKLGCVAGSNVYNPYVSCKPSLICIHKHCLFNQPLAMRKKIKLLQSFNECSAFTIWSTRWNACMHVIGHIFTIDVQCVCELMSSANRHISFSTHSQPQCHTLFKQVLLVLWKTGPINTMYGVPPRGHLQGQTRDNSNTRFFTLKRNTYI